MYYNDRKSGLGADLHDSRSYVATFDQAQQQLFGRR